jgi:predicted transcriptional regulator
MSNSNVTPTRTIRIDDELWHAVQEQARLDNVTVTSIIVDSLLDYLKSARLAALAQSGVE